MAGNVDKCTYTLEAIPTDHGDRSWHEANCSRCKAVKPSQRRWLRVTLLPLLHNLEREDTHVRFWQNGGAEGRWPRPLLRCVPNRANTTKLRHTASKQTEPAINLHHEDAWGSGNIAPHINFETRLRWMISFTLLPLYPRAKNRRSQFDMRLGGPQSQCRRCREENSLSPDGARTQVRHMSYP
jgi:hypothetical protein